MTKKVLNLVFWLPQGIFSSVIKDFTGSKEKHAPLAETEDSKESIQELSAIFSNENFPCDADNNNDNLTVDEDDLELSIGRKVSCICATEYYIALKKDREFVICLKEFMVCFYWWPDYASQKHIMLLNMTASKGNSSGFSYLKWASIYLYILYFLSNG